MNKVLLVGRIAYPPHYNDNAASQFPPVLNVVVKCVHRYKSNDGTIQERAQQIKAALWGKLAELNRNVSEGDLVSLDGRLQNKKIQDKDGNERWETQVVAASFESLANGSQRKEQPQESPPAEDEFGDSDIPF